jgi:hypothetical protein
MKGIGNPGQVDYKGDDRPRDCLCDASTYLSKPLDLGHDECEEGEGGAAFKSWCHKTPTLFGPTLIEPC